MFVISTNAIAIEQQDIQEEIYTTLSEEVVSEILSEINYMLQDQQAQKNQSKVAPEKYAGSGIAPGLYYLQIIGVDSKNKGYEEIGEYIYSTQKDHGGSWLRAWTLELGYAGTPYATINGKSVQKTDQIELCKDYGGNILLCKPGMTIIGYFRQWKLDGYQKGLFRYQNTSTSSPWGTLNDRLTIR